MSDPPVPDSADDSLAPTFASCRQFSVLAKAVLDGVVEVAAVVVSVVVVAVVVVSAVVVVLGGDELLDPPPPHPARARASPHRAAMQSNETCLRNIGSPLRAYRRPDPRAPAGRRQPQRVSSATVSTWGVCGNMST